MENPADQRLQKAMSILKAKLDGAHLLIAGLESVKELWEEWDVGVDGGAPVRELEERYGTKWCDADERRLFNRRRSALNFIQQLSCEAQCYIGAGAEVATQLAVQYLDDSRKMRRKTLNWLSKNIALIHDEVKSRLIARISLDQAATQPCINQRGQPLTATTQYRSVSARYFAVPHSHTAVFGGTAVCQRGIWLYHSVTVRYRGVTVRYRGMTVRYRGVTVRSAAAM
ncbi:Transcriptional activator of glycolytic enzyme [Phytophthora infestans]|uniref:Transcriptional activator of glycolytic enzyme n=1 Tax=Phytophthora infestans TaxID=4787 RepID=A0A8S9V8Z0_PHYIN|nr:Transcriptional activator of glycolytic enzyme [Phytophthora infestans]